MKKCEMENLDINQVQNVVNALQMIADAFQKLIAEPDNGEFAVYAPHDGFKTISRAKMEAMALKEFKKIALISPLAKGILNNVECSDTGKLTVEGVTEP